MKVFEMFAGYGGASFALKKAGIEHEVVGYSEMDKYAIQCFEQNHKGKNYGDCTKINPKDLPDFDLLTGGFPCQAFSVAGKGLGEMDTRGTLFNEIIRIAEVKKPRYMLLENVKGLTNKKHKDTFNKILSELKRIGYDVIWKVLNTKNYGIPQNRERVFFVCKLGKWEFNKFQFPQEEELKIFIKDILEEEVDKKYFITNKKKEFIKRHNLKINYDKEVANTIPSQFWKQRKQECLNLIRVIGNLHTDGWDKRYEEIRRVYSKEGISPTIPTSQGGGVTPKILEGELIRKYTPKECFRLMGFLNDEINLDNLSDTQRYKLAGNGWDVNLVSKIFKQMFAIPKLNYAKVRQDVK